MARRDDIHEDVEMQVPMCIFVFYNFIKILNFGISEISKFRKSPSKYIVGLHCDHLIEEYIYIKNIYKLTIPKFQYEIKILIAVSDYSQLVH